MTSFILTAVISLLASAGVVCYWIRRLNREYRERIVLIEAHTATEHDQFVTDKHAWDEKQAKAQAEYNALLAAIRAELVEDSLGTEPSSNPPIVTPGGA